MQNLKQEEALSLADGEGVVPTDSSSRQKNETIQALLEMNELWTLKLGDLIE